MRSIVLPGILAAFAALTTACGAADSVAPMITSASPRREVSTSAQSATAVGQSVDQYVWLSCANGGTGETVRVTGALRYDLQSITDGSGVAHLSIKSNTSGLTAVGLTTDTFFRGFMTERVNSRAEDELNMDVRISDIIRFVAPASGDSYSLMVTSHFIVYEGSYVLWEQTWNEVCR